jgi:hypothetical protein
MVQDSFADANIGREQGDPESLQLLRDLKPLD